MLQKIHYILFLLFLFSLISCNESDDTNESSSFRSEFLIDIADKRIVPSLQDLRTEGENLKTAIEIFERDKSQSNLEEVRVKWKACFNSWQKVAPFNFGPAAEQGLQKTLFEEIALFPIDTTSVEAKIANNTFALNDFERDTRGLLTIEYIIYYNQGNNVLQGLMENSQRLAYLKAICEQMNTKVSTVVNKWENGYRQSFVNNLGTDAGSSTSEFYNAYLASFERIKNFKIELPLGLSAGQSGEDKSQLEAPYSNQSFMAIKSDLENIFEIWRGNENTKGFKFYLQNTEGGESLISATETQISAINEVLNRFPEDFSMVEAIDNNNTQDLKDLHMEIQKLTRYLKSDLSSLMGIAITFNSGDGD